MRLFLQDGPTRLQILSRSHMRELRDAGAAKELLHPLLANPGNLAAMRNALASEHAGVGVEGVDPGTAKVSFPDLDKKAYEPGGTG
jgi:hypothetical protein